MKEQIKLLLFLFTVILFVHVVNLWSNSSFHLFTDLHTFLYNWQQLIGSFLGAITPIGLFIWDEKRRTRQKKKDHMSLLQKSIVSAINNLSDIDRMLHDFFDNQLQQLKDGIKEDSSNGSYSARQAFIPMSATFSFDREIIKETTDSSYLENLKIDVFSTSEELPILMQDINKQFERTVNLNTHLGSLSLNDPIKQNEVFLSNVERFETFVRKQTFEHNIPVYLRKLVSILVPLEKMNEWGIKKWRESFDFQGLSASDVSEKMTEYFHADVDSQIKKIQKHFKSKLLLSGE